MDYPKSEAYDKLYARYLKRPVSEMLDFVRPIKGKVVWDLCAGAGRLSRECLRRGAKQVVAIDGAHDMLKPLWDWMHAGGKWTKRLTIVCDSMETIFPLYEPEPDVVFCRQAVNYWFNRHTIGKLADFMSKGSKFIFNTFNTRPPLQPLVKQYEYDGAKFTEVSWRVSKTKMVHHVQIREGMEPHVTEFRWIPESEYIRILSPHFAIGKVTEGRTDIYICTRRGNRR